VNIVRTLVEEAPVLLTDLAGKPGSSVAGRSGRLGGRQVTHTFFLPNMSRNEENPEVLLKSLRKLKANMSCPNCGVNAPIGSSSLTSRPSHSLLTYWYSSYRGWFW